MGVIYIFFFSLSLISNWSLVSLCLYYLDNKEKRYLKRISTFHDVLKIKLGHKHKEPDKTYDIHLKKVNWSQQGREGCHVYTNS